MNDIKFDKQLSDVLKKYNAEIQNQIKKTTDIVSEETKRALRESSPRRSGNKLRHGKYRPGSYARSWSTSVTRNSFADYEVTTYNRVHFRLTHLLENGHASRNGGRVSPQVHIAPIEEKAITDFTNRILKIIKTTK